MLEETFPELLRFKLIQILFATNRKQQIMTMTNSDQTTFFMESYPEACTSVFSWFWIRTDFVQLLYKQERPSAMLYQFKVSNDAQIRSVFVKGSSPFSENSRTNRSMLRKTSSLSKNRTQRHALASLYSP